MTKPSAYSKKAWRLLALEATTTWWHGRSPTLDRLRSGSVMRKRQYASFSKAFVWAEISAPDVVIADLTGLSAATADTEPFLAARILGAADAALAEIGVERQPTEQTTR